MFCKCMKRARVDVVLIPGRVVVKHARLDRDGWGQTPRPVYVCCVGYLFVNFLAQHHRHAVAVVVVCFGLGSTKCFWRQYTTQRVRRGGDTRPAICLEEGDGGGGVTGGCVGRQLVATLVATTTTTKKTNSNIQIWNLFVDRHRDCVFRCCRGR